MTVQKLALILAATQILHPAARADPVNYPFVPESGATWMVTEHRSIVSTDPAKPSSEAVVVGTLKIVDTRRDGYLMEWTTNTVTAGGVTLGANGPVPELIIGVPVRFDADESGAPLHIRNADALIGQAAAGVALSMGKKIRPSDQKKNSVPFSPP